MKKTRHGFLKENRVYILMLLFITFFNAANFLLPEFKERNQKEEQVFAKQKEAAEQTLRLRELAVVRNISADQNLRSLAGVLGSLFLFVILAGFGLLITYVRFKFKRLEPLPEILSLPAPKWETIDAARVAVIFVFLNHVLYWAESILEYHFGAWIKDASIGLIFNAAAADFSVLGFVLYFVCVKSKQRLIAIGIGARDFFQNLFFGVLGYVSFLPVLTAVIFISCVLGGYFNIKPETQPFFDIFIQEKRLFVLICLSFLVIIIGPVIEEIFFRGFLYSALRKKSGVFFSMFATSFIFAALHMNTIGFLPIFALAFILVYMFEKTRSLTVSIVIHSLHNAAMVMFILLAKFFSG